MKLPSVEELRQNGYKVRVIHRRHFEKCCGHKLTGYYLSKTEAENLEYSSVKPKGGKTIVQVRTPDGTELEGIAECSLQDNFCRKLGVRIALGRALRGGK